MRIVSLVPNATEILFALGAGDQVVGVTHECDYPPEARALPHLTGSALRPEMSASAVDAAVSAQLASGESLYTLDEDLLARLAPDILFTQNLCPVCAVSSKQVDSALAPLAARRICPEIVSLDPKSLEDVLLDVRRVGKRLGLREQACALEGDLRSRLDAVRADVAGRQRPRVAALEWMDPPFSGGHWVPEMIEVAGGVDVLARPGDPSRRISWSEVAAADPDWIVLMPCGYDEAGARAQAELLTGNADWLALRAVANGNVACVDANGCFSRPGPRLVDGIERLAQILSS